MRSEIKDANLVSRALSLDRVPTVGAHPTGQTGLRVQPDPGEDSLVAHTLTEPYA